MNINALCYLRGDRHTWESVGLDVNADGVLVSVRRCLRCPVVQEKPYGAGSRRAWQPARVVTPEIVWPE